MKRTLYITITLLSFGMVMNLFTEVQSMNVQSSSYSDLQAGQAQAQSADPRFQQGGQEPTQSAGADTSTRNDQGVTPLIAAVKEKDFDAVKLLIGSSDIDAIDDKGKTALMWAIEGGRFDIARFLIENGANIHIHSMNEISWGQSVLALVLNQFDPKECQGSRITRRGAITAHDEAAVDKPITAFAEYLIAHGAEVDEVDDLGSTPLMYAVCNCNFSAVELLVRHGANVNVQSNRGFTPLLEAARAPNLQIFEYLLERGADITAKNIGGRSVLMYAVESRSIPIADLAIKRGLDVRERDNKHLSPLMLAANQENVEMLKYLTTQLELVKNKAHPANATPLPLVRLDN